MNDVPYTLTQNWKLGLEQLHDQDVYVLSMVKPCLEQLHDQDVYVLSMVKQITSRISSC